MTKADVRIVLTSATGKNVYIQAWISRNVARKIEKLLEENNVSMVSPYSEKKGDQK
jgi:hypothetical protein